MEPQPGLLAAILRQRSEELADLYDAGRARLEEGLASGEIHAVHGADHWRNIEMYAARLVPERVLAQLAAAEIAVMAAACILHDLRFGEQELATALSREPERWGMQKLSAVAVRQVCEAMTVGGVRLWRGQRWAYLGREAADLRRIGAILHVVDRIDVEHTDCPLPEEIDDIEPENAAGWPHQRGLTVGLIDPREGVLRLDLTINNKVWRRQVEEHFMPHCVAAMEASRNILLAAGMAYREIELHDMHAKPSADVERARELQRARAGSRRRPEKPFKSLDPYSEEESHLLAARDEETIRLAGRALTSPLTVLTGESGVGKTSLVGAGVIPWLREHFHDGVYARCLNDPTQSLIHAITARLKLDKGAFTSLPAAARALAEQAQNPVVLVLDQSQELFTRLGSRTRLEFAHDLAGLLGMPGDPVHVLLAIQREYFVRLAELLPALPTIFQEVNEQKRLSREQAELVIRRSLGRFRVRFDELVTSHLVDDLCTAEGVLPVELQICCEVLFQNLEEGERTVEYDVYRRIGPARRILDGLLESRLRTFRWRRHTLAKAVLVNCVTATRTKALVRVEECALDIGADREVTEELMEELVGLGLLRRLEVEDGDLYELRHEYLAQSLGPWLSDVEGEAKDVDDLLHRELNNYQRFQMLLDKEKLRLIHQYRRRLTFTAEELDLMIRSAAQERYEVDYWLARVNELTVSQQMVLCVDLLYSPEPDLRDALRLMISRLDHQAVLPTLLDSLREADPIVRETAIEVLREIDQNLVAALQPGSDVGRQQQAAYALGQIGARHAVPELVETARHGVAEVREQAVEALAELDRSRSADLLLRSLRSGSRGSRWNAALALGRLGRDSGVRERIQREAERPEAPESVVYAYARACLEGRQLDDADRVLRILDKRAVPDDQRQHLVDTWEELETLRRQEQRGLLAWSMYRGSPGGSAYTPAGLRLPLMLKWEFATGDRVLSSPAVANGVVYIGSTDKSLYALDADSGAAHWTFPTEAELHSTPCVVGGRVFVGGMDGLVHAVEAESGRPLWSRRFGEAVGSSIRGTEERLYVGTADGGVFAFSPEDGRVQWEYRLQGAVDASPAIDGGLVAVGTREEGLVALDADSGAERWRWRVMGGMAGSPAVVDGRIFVGSGDGRVEVLDTDGVLIWSALLDSAAGSSPALAQGRVYVGGVDGEIAAFRLATGERLWTFRTEGEVSASPTVAGKAVFMGSHGGQLFALDAGTGRPLWRYRTGYSIHSTPAVADGRLFVALRYYNVCAFAEPVEVEDMR